MSRFWVLAVVGVLAGCSAQNAATGPARDAEQVPAPPVATAKEKEADPIEALAAELGKSHGMWTNGSSPVLELPADAPVEEVVAEFFRKVSYEQGPVTTQTIQQTRSVRIADAASNDEYTAVLLDTNLGRKILLLQYSPAIGWWSKIFDR